MNIKIKKTTGIILFIYFFIPVLLDLILVFVNYQFNYAYGYNIDKFEKFLMSIYSYVPLIDYYFMFFIVSSNRLYLIIFQTILFLLSWFMVYNLIRLGIYLCMRFKI